MGLRRKPPNCVVFPVLFAATIYGKEIIISRIMPVRII
jgi:hypothetical protein